MSSISLTYTKYELKRTFRNRRFFIFALIFPVSLFLLIAGTNKHAHIVGISFPVYYLSGMISFGTISAVLAGGSRISMERSAGWTRQIRITPLSMVVYLRTKLLTAYMMAVLSILLLTVAALALGVHVPFGRWLEMVGLTLIGLIPYAIMGIALGNLLSGDAMGPAQGGITAFMSFLGGAFGPLANHGALHSISKLLPSYWTTNASHVLLGEHAWSSEGWIVVAVWTAAMIRLAKFAFDRSGVRV